MFEKKGKPRWIVLGVAVETSAEAKEIEVDVYARLVARILERESAAQATDRAA
jgi:hypothetical protein